jgi:prophage regulatory protein
MTPNTSPAPDKLLRLRDLVELTALSRATIYRLMNAGKFPTPIQIGGANRWPAGELAQFIESRKATRGPKGA